MRADDELPTASAVTIAPLPAIDRGKQVMRALADYVERAALKAGDRLPTERELMAALSVGRSTIREAIRRFEALGVDRDAQRQRHLSRQADLGRHDPHAAIARHGAAARRAVADAGGAPRHRGRGEHGRGAPQDRRRPAPSSRRSSSRWSACISPRARRVRRTSPSTSRSTTPRHNPLFRQLLAQMREAFERFWDQPVRPPGFRAPLLPVPPRALRRDRRQRRRAGARQDARRSSQIVEEDIEEMSK